MSNVKRVEVSDKIEEAYMTYAMSTIVDRAIPDVRDGLLPVHRRILFSMFKAGITHNKPRAKSSEPVAETLKIHHHGDASTYGSISLLTEQNETLLHPFLDGEGSFGKVYSDDNPSHMRYTFCRLNKFTEDTMFNDLNKDTVKFIGEDKEHLQPVVLPTLYPSILVKPNTAIAVGESCKFGSFRLSEVCDATIEYIKNKDVEIVDYLTPDFSTGGYLIYNKEQLKAIYDTGRGSVTLRSKYKFDKDNSCIEVYEIPYSTTCDKIIPEVSEKMNKYKEITDVRNEIGFDEELGRESLKITIDVKKNTNVDLLMSKLFKETSLESKFSYNMNCLVDFVPKVLGVKQILDEWINFRVECISKSIMYDIKNKSDKLHILKGLERVLLDIDKAIYIIRHSKDVEIISSLISEFKIDEIQAEEVSNMKLRNINKDYILKQIKDIEKLQQEVEDLKNTLNSEDKIKEIIISQLQEIKSKYSKSRKTEILYESEIATTITKQDLIEDYNCRILYTSEGYIKKHLKQSENHKLKQEDSILGDITSTNKSTLLIFTNKANRYRLPVHELETVTPSSYGIYIKNIIDLEEDEQIIKIVSIEKEIGNMCFVFNNGKIVKIGIKSYMSANKKLQNCYNTESNLIAIEYIENDVDVLMVSSEGKTLIVNTDRFAAKGSRNSQGNVAIKLDDNLTCIGATISITQDNNFKITTAKNKELEFMLSDVAPTNKPNEERTLFTYLQGRNGNTGNFVINTRVSSDSVTEYKTI